MDIKIHLDEQELALDITDKLRRDLCEKIEERLLRNYSIKEDTKKAVQDIYKNHKEDIINVIVDRAVKEIVRKALPQLIDKFGGE